MSKLNKVFNVARDTEVENRSKASFLFFFFLTHCMNFSLRKLPQLGQFLKKTFSRLPKNEFIIKNQLGTWSVFPFNDTMTISASYFEEELGAWPGKTEGRNIFLDIGANIGRYTLIAANQYNYSHIVSIEANPVTFALLKKNIQLNNLDNKVTTQQVAVGNKEGEVTIQSNLEHLGGGNIVDFQENPAVMDVRTQVHLTTVDRLFTQQNLDPKNVNFIKIDVEGMEAEVLEGMTSVLSHMPQKSGIMMEISNGDKAMNILLKNGFKLIETRANDNLFIKQS